MVIASSSAPSKRVILAMLAQSSTRGTMTKTCKMPQQVSYIMGTSRRALSSPPPSSSSSSSSSSPVLENHTMNCGEALKKAHETDSFSQLVDADVQVLQGIGPKHKESLDILGIHTVQDLADYKFYHLAKAIFTMSLTETTATTEDGATTSARLPNALLNVNKGLDKAYETKTLQEICAAPVEALQGLSHEKGLLWKQVGSVESIEDLAKSKYCQWAESIVTLARYEEEVTKDEE